MLPKFSNYKEMMKAFSDEKKCRTFLEHQRWNGKPVCPHCGYSDKIYKLNDGKTYKCGNKECYKKFTVTVGTIFENSNIKLNVWFAAIYVTTAHKKGISSIQLAKDLGVTQKTSWFMMHRIREMVRTKHPEALEGVIEMDETYVGGKNKNRHKDKKIEHSSGRNLEGKTPVFGAIQREGNLRTRVINDAKITTLKPLIKEMVKKGSILITDDLPVYQNMRDEYTHLTVNHSDGEYGLGTFHNNTVECFWSILKRGLYGIYHHVTPKHLNRYCDEFSYRFNTRKIKDNERFEVSLKHVNGGLSYKQLTGKA